MATSLGRLLVDVAANAAGFERDMQKVQRSAKSELRKVRREIFKTERDLERARGKVKRLATGFAALGAVSIAGAAREFNKIAQEADKLDKAATLTGFAVEELQEFQFAAKQAAGVTEKEFNLGMQRFNRRVGEVVNNSGELLKTINRLGIEITDSSGKVKTQTQLLNEFAVAINDAESGQEALSIAFKLFDSEGARLINLLKQGEEGMNALREQFRSTGAMLTEETIEATVRFNESLNVLQANLKGISVGIFSDIIKPLSDYAAFLAETEEGQAELNRIINAFGETLKTVGIAIAAAFTARLAAASIEVAVLSTRIAILTRRKLALQGASVAAGTAVAGFGRVLRLASGPVGIAVTALAAIAFNFSRSNEEAKKATRAFAQFRKESDRLRGRSAEEERIRGLTAAQVQGEISALERTLRTIQAQSGSASVIADIQAKIEQLTAVLQGLNDEGETTTKTNKASTASFKGLIDGLNKFATQAAQDAADRAKEVADAMRDMTDEIADASAELGGPFARNLREFQAEAQRVATLARKGLIGDDQAIQRIDLAREKFDRLNLEIRDGLLRTFETDLANALPPVISRMLGLADATAEVARQSGALSQIGSNFAQSVIQGGGIQDSLTNALTGFAGQSFAESLEDTIAVAAEDGLSAAFESEGFQRNSAEGFALALGQAVEGDLGQAALTAVGNAIAGPIGGFIGSIIGDALFGDSKPKFQIRGTDADRATDAGTDRQVEGALGEIEFAFREIEDEAKTQIVNAFVQFDETIAGVIRDAGQLDAVEDALARFGVSSRSDSESIEELLQKRFDVILGTFDSFTQNFVQQADTLESQVQRLASIFVIENEIILGRALGLSGDISSLGGPSPGPSPGPPGGGGFGPPGARPSLQQVEAFNATIQGTGNAASVTNPVLQQTLELVDDLRIGSEPLTDTFERLVSVTNSLDEALALTGNSIGKTREDLVRFGADLVAIFGDDAQRLGQALDRALGAAFSDEELSQQTIDSAKQRASDLLTSIGITVTEETFTQGGLRELLETFLGALGPEETAKLIEAGSAIATVIEEMSSLGDEAEKAAQSLKDTINSELQRAVLGDLRLEFLETRKRFAELTEQARELGLSEQFLGRIRAAETARMDQLAQKVRASLKDLTELLFGRETTEQQISNVNRVAEARQNAFEQEMRALERIADFVDSVLLSGVSPLTPGERVREARSQLEEAFQAAAGGDIGALEDLPQLADQFFREFQSFTGGVGGFATEFDQIVERLNRLQQAGPQNQPSATSPPTALDFSRGIERVEEEITELQRVSSTFALVDQLGLLSQLTERAPSDIAGELGIPLGRVIETLTGDLPGLTGEALSGFFDELVNETNAQLNELTNLETLAVNRNKLLEQLVGDVEPPPQVIDPVEGPSGPIGGPITPPPSQGVTSTQSESTQVVSERLANIEQILRESNSLTNEQTTIIRRQADDARRDAFITQPSRGAA